MQSLNPNPNPTQALDYSLPNSERLAHIQSLDLSHPTPYQLELYANYLLGGAKPVTPKPTHVELNQADQQTTPTNPQLNHPRQTIDWNHPIMEPYKLGIDQLKALEQAETTNTKRAYQLRKWRLETQLDAGTLWKSYRNQIQITPAQTPITPINLEDHVDLTNSFHVKHVMAHYSRLKQSENQQTQFFMDWVDYVLERAPLSDWQEHLLRRRVDGVNHVTIGVELANMFGKETTPSGMSQVLRTIYRAVAKTALQLEREWEERNNPLAWRTCKVCGERKLVEFGFYGQERKCKVCRK